MKTRRALWTVLLVCSLALGASARQRSLVEAARVSDLELLERLLESGADPNSADADQTTALHWRVLADDLDGTERLLRAGANAQATNRLGVSPLHLAATNGNAVIIQRLLEAGADANASLPGGETALMTAARTGTAEAIETLIAHGADVNAREDWKGQTALMWAAAENNADAIRVLIDAGADVDASSNAGTFNAFLFAVRGGHVAAADALIEAGADVRQTLPDGMSALVLAVLNAHYELAAFLLDEGADPNADAQGWTALHQIAWSRRPNAGFNLPGAPATGDLDSLDLVRRLVAAGADINRRMTEEPKDGNRNMLNRIGSTAFLMAAKSADIALMRVLLEEGADPSIPNEDGTTALMVAAGVGIWAPGENPGTHEEALRAAELALEVGGGEVTDIDDNGETAVHGAVYRGGNTALIQFLADRGAPLDVVNEKGWTPLVAAEGVEYTPAVLKRYPEAAELLRRLMKERGLEVPEPGPALSVALTNLEATDMRTQWEGVFTEAQAERGRLVYQEACRACHFEDLAGDAEAPPLAGPDFLNRWIGSTVRNLMEVVRNSMPPDAPNSLDGQSYVDVVSYLLRSNGNPAGNDELTTDLEELGRIRLTAPE